MNIVDWYLECTSPTNPSIWPFQYLTICDWGDGITSAMKWTDPTNPIYRVNGDQYEEGSIEKVMNFECSSLKSWLEYWLDGLPLFTLGTQKK